MKDKKLGLGLAFISIVLIPIACVLLCLLSLLVLYVVPVPIMNTNEESEDYLENYFENKCGYKNLDVKLNNDAKASLVFWSRQSGETVTYTFKFKASKDGELLESGDIKVTILVDTSKIISIEEINGVQEEDYVCRK